MTDKYVVACDGSPASVRALNFAVDEAGHHDASIVVAHVLEWLPYTFLTLEEIEERQKRRTEEMARARKSVVDPIVASLEETGVKIEVEIRYGNIYESLLDIIKRKGASRLFVGRTGQSEFATRVFGSVASTMAQTAPVPCTVVP